MDQALADLRAQGVLDDSRYAKDLMARLTLGKCAGRHKIAFELKRRGIPKKISDELLGTLSNEDEAGRARELARGCVSDGVQRGVKLLEALGTHGGE